MPKLEFFQSLWAMERRLPGVPEPAVEEHFRRVAEAGYDGLCLDPAASEAEECQKLKPLFDENGLACMINAFPYSDDDMWRLFDLADELEARQVNAISGIMPIRPEEAVACVERWIEEAQRRGITLLFETHRDSLLNDLYFTLQLMDMVPDMRLCADLSHFVVDREMRAPISAVDQAHIDKLLERSDCFQGRVANREQVQVQLDFPQHQEWVGIFRAWWQAGMRSWRARSADDATLIFLCELGPPPYAMTDRRQRELSDRWQEAMQIRTWVSEAWQSLDKENGMTRKGGQDG